jgi:hypothetical protein
MLFKNTTPTEPPTEKKPCWRDLHDLVRDHLPQPIVQLVPLEELQRRVAELKLTHPRFLEEAPLVLSHETKRRQMLLRSGLHVAGSAAAHQEVSYSPSMLA